MTEAKQPRAVANGRRDEPSAIGGSWDSPGTGERLNRRDGVSALSLDHPADAPDPQPPAPPSPKPGE
jgi:hypothetical protein